LPRKGSKPVKGHGERMTKRIFQPGFRIGLHQKDVDLVLKGAKFMRLAMLQTPGAAQLMQVCSGHGLQDQDHLALVNALEIMGNHQVAADPQA